MSQMVDMPGPLDFWGSLTLNELVAWSFVLFACFLLFVHLLGQFEKVMQRRRRRRSRQ